MNLFKALIGAVVGAFLGFVLMQVISFMSGSNMYGLDVLLWKDIPDFEFTFKWIWKYGRASIMGITGIIGGAFYGFQYGYEHKS